MNMPGTVLAAKIIGWLIVAYFVLGALMVLIQGADLGGYFAHIGIVGFMFLLAVASYFGIPLMYLQPERPAGRVVVIVLYGLAAFVLLLLAANASREAIVPIIPAVVCLTVVGLVCTPTAAQWSALRPRGYLVAAPPAPIPHAQPREAFVPFAFQPHNAPVYPTAPVQHPAAPPAAPPVAQWSAPPPVDEHGVPIPPPPPTAPPGYRWQPPDLRR